MRLRTPAPPPDLARRPPDVAPAAADLRSARRRATWRTRLRRAGLTALVLAVLLGVTWVVGYSDLLALRTVSVIGVEKPLADTVERAAQAPLGSPLARVDTEAVGARVEAVPAVLTATVTRGWPHTLQVSVTPRTPLAGVETGEGWRFVDEAGVVFGAAPGPPADLPLIIAPSDDDAAPARAAAVRVAGALSDEVLRRVGRIEASSPVEVRLVLRDGRPVGWGSAEQSDRKAAVLEVLLDTPATGYDVSVPDRPTLRPVP